MTGGRGRDAVRVGRPGRVSATPEKPPARARYDVVVVGGGLLGAATAAMLRRFAPDLTVLLAEADGLPNEGGASVAVPGLLPPAADRPVGESAASLRWAQGLVEQMLPHTGSWRSGWLRVIEDRSDPEAAAAQPLRRMSDPAVVETVTALTGVDAEHPVVIASGGWAAADALALGLAGRAVHEGADLLLNTRVRPLGPSRLLLERLALDRRMALGVRARHTIETGSVVVACGAAGAVVAEQGLDLPVSLATAYLQFPHVRLEVVGGAASMPVVEVAGWRFRPSPGGALLVPPAPPADPVGYVPTGGRLLGVPVGLRRELIEALLEEPMLAPLVASGRLELGKSVRSVRGVFVSVPDGGRPVARGLGNGWWLLAGSGSGVHRDLVAAADIAANVAREVGGAEPPWPPEA